MTNRNLYVHNNDFLHTVDVETDSSDDRLEAGNRRHAAQRLLIVVGSRQVPVRPSFCRARETPHADYRGGYGVASVLGRVGGHGVTGGGGGILGHSYTFGPAWTKNKTDQFASMHVRLYIEWLSLENRYIPPCSRAIHDSNRLVYYGPVGCPLFKYLWGSRIDFSRFRSVTLHTGGYTVETSLQVSVCRLAQVA
jgi:hypothetical protein